jgi:hypothetical protein
VNKFNTKRILFFGPLLLELFPPNPPTISLLLPPPPLSSP